MSKHHAVEDEPQSSDMSWIRGLAKPVVSSPPEPAEIPAPYYGSLVTRAPRHAAPADDRLDASGSSAEPAAERTAPIRRISAEQVDTLIGHLDAVAPTSENPEQTLSEGPQQNDEPIDIGLDLFGSSPDDLFDSSADDDAQIDDSEIEDAQAEDAQSGASRSVPARPLRDRMRKPAIVGAAAALCLLTVGGGSGSVAAGSAADSATGSSTASKTVAIVVDGQIEKVSTLSNSVAGALATAGIHPSSHDVLVPGMAASISNGSTIVLDRGRLLTLTIDGKQKQIWTTARTVDDALAQLGTRTSDLALSANRSRSIPLTGLSVNGSTLRTVALSIGGQGAKSSTTAAKTVAELLAQHQITLGTLDTVVPAMGTKLRDGLVITIDRVVMSTTSTTVTLPQPASVTIPDATMVKGKSTVVQQGRPGSQLITYTVTSINGKPSAKTQIGRKTVVAAVGTITHVGTKTSFTYVGNEVFTNDTSFGVNWDGLAMCESTHNPKAINANPVAGLPTYGMFQFDLPTWASVGGSGNPIDATPEEQLMRAKLLFQQRGLEPWACRDAAH